MQENELLRLFSFSQSCKKDHFNRFLFIFLWIRTPDSRAIYSTIFKMIHNFVIFAQGLDKRGFNPEFQNPKQDLSAFCVKMLISGRSDGPNAIKPKSGHWKIQRGALSAALISTLPSHCFLIQVYSNKFSFNHVFAHFLGARSI